MRRTASLLFLHIVYFSFFFSPTLVTAQYGSATVGDRASSAEQIAKASLRVRIQNSSIEVSQYQLDEFIRNRGLPKTGGFGITIKGPIKRGDIAIVKEILAPYLDKGYLKTHTKPTWYKSDVTDVGLYLALDSEGGDMYAAMAIGRMFRAARVSSSVPPNAKCLSACVLLLAGSVDRFVQGNVGIHRPYSSSTDAISYDELQRRTTKLGDDVAAYLKEMNISSGLYDAMKAIPSEKIRVLSYEELKGFGLSDKDPVFEELIDNQTAEMAGLNKSEYLARKALASRCILEGNSRLASDNSYLDNLSKFGEMRRKCEMKIIFKDVIDESGNWKGTQLQARCIELIDLVTSATIAKDWTGVLAAAKETEQRCSKGKNKEELADSLNWQAEAYFELGNYIAAKMEAERCLRIANYAACHITKGMALVEASKEKEGSEALRIGKRLATEQIAQIDIELRDSKTDDRKNALLDSKRGWYASKVKLANAYLKYAAAAGEKKLEKR